MCNGGGSATAFGEGNREWDKVTADLETALWVKYPQTEASGRWRRRNGGNRLARCKLARIFVLGLWLPVCSFEMKRHLSWCSAVWCLVHIIHDCSESNCNLIWNCQDWIKQLCEIIDWVHFRGKYSSGRRYPPWGWSYYGSYLLVPQILPYFCSRSFSRISTLGSARELFR